MDIMKRFIAYLIFTAIAFSAKATVNEHEGELPRMSLLTCSPGEELYTCFGHSAIRYTDTLNGEWVDFVFNYGTFEFSEGFYLKFARGKLNYMLSVEEFAGFQQQYLFGGRGIFENEFKLNAEQIRSLGALLIENAKKENRYFQYDFFYDNCATRVRDIVLKAFPEIQQNEKTFSNRPRFRHDIDVYLAHQYWADFGIDLVLGMRCDKTPEAGQTSFLPDSLQSNMMAWTLNGKKVLGRTQELLPIDDSLFEKQAPSAKPILYVTLSALLFGGFSLYLGWKKRGWNFLERLFLGFFGLLGVVLFVMWFLTDHTTTKWNFNILWANPMLFALAFARVEALKAWIRKYAFIQMGLSAYVLLAIYIPAIGIQTFPDEIGPWLIAQLILLYRFSRITKSVNG
jgi:hypothetical protein